MTTTFDYTFPPIEEYTLPNGMRVIWLSDSTHPVQSLTLQIPVGKLSDPAFREGTAELAVSLMLKGPKSISSEEFTETFEHAGASLFADVKDEYTIISVRMLKKAANEIVPLFWKMISNPALDKKEFLRIKKEMVTGLKAEFSDPSTLANKHFYAELFGREHPAGRNNLISNVKRISLEQIVSFYTTCIGPKDSCMVIAGDGSTTAMKEEFENLFVAWQKKSDCAPSVSDSLPVLSENRIRIIDKPEFSQTTILMGHTSIHELHRNKIPLAIANYILGGGNFSSRLMARIRSEMGRTYGIASQLSCLKSYGIFSIGSSTQNNQVEGVITAILDVYDNFVSNGPTESENDKAKQFAAGNMAFELEGLNNIVEKLLWLRFYGRDNSYIESFDSLISPIKSTGIRDALQKNFMSENFVIIAVGKRIEIEKQLEKFGNVQHFNCRDNPLK